MMGFGLMMDGNYTNYFEIFKKKKIIVCFLRKVFRHWGKQYLVLIFFYVFHRNNLNYITEEIQNPRRYVWKEG